eukprot:5765759-Amphidinium_carterae.1
MGIGLPPVVCKDTPQVTQSSHEPPSFIRVFLAHATQFRNTFPATILSHTSTAIGASTERTTLFGQPYA